MGSEQCSVIAKALHVLNAGAKSEAAETERIDEYFKLIAVLRQDDDPSTVEYLQSVLPRLLCAATRDARGGTGEAASCDTANDLQCLALQVIAYFGASQAFAQRFDATQVRNVLETVIHVLVHSLF